MSACHLEPPSVPRPEPGLGERALDRAPALLDGALLLSALLVLGSCAAFALCHLNTGFNLDTGSGVHMGLAAHLNAGRFYPALYDGQYYGGTRYMPLYFVLHAS